MILFSLSTFLYFIVITDEAAAPTKGLLVVSIATNETDGYKQFMYSTSKHGLKTEVYGLGMAWDGGDMQRDPGGGQKINILVDSLEKYKDDNELVILFSDSYDAIIIDNEAEILRKYKNAGEGVVFAAEEYCWPDGGLSVKYPQVAFNEKRFLNSGGFMGKASDIYAIVTHQPVLDRDDDQLYYTKIFLDPVLRKKWKITLDKKSDIFQALNGALDDVELKFKSSSCYMYNTVTGTTPSVIHGNGPIKPEFYRVSHYLLGAWTPASGCIRCNEDTISLKDIKTKDYPQVMVAIFLERPTPFVQEFFWLVGNLTYPKDRIDIFLHNAVEYHKGDVDRFVAENTNQYGSVQIVDTERVSTEATAKNKAVEACMRKSCKYLFMLDSVAHITNENTLTALIQQNRSVLAPLLARPDELFSNFWGAVNVDGFYARSKDYIDIVENKRVGVWSAAYISQAYLIHASVLPNLLGSYESAHLDAEMSFCKYLRTEGFFMYVTNRENFGHLIDNENFQTTHLHNELYEIFSNPYNWDRRYIHPDYYEISKKDTPIPQPCPDVYSLHVLTPRFCWELIEEVEHFGDWSGGKHEDKRLSGGYENVPTDDIHLNQVGLDQQWLKFLKSYIMPLQQKVFIGYFHDPPASHMNFVVRYKVTAQPYLRPHHDSSTYSINIALNRAGIDFQGGGTNFLRYNCSVTGTSQGWVLIHPGKLTHYHEGLRTTDGTRYIMVSFVDP